MTDKPQINVKNLLSYGILAFPISFAGIPIYIHSPDFYATETELTLATIGIVLLVLRAVDAVQDPFIGYFSDKYFHHRKIIFLIGALCLGGGFFMLFNPIEELVLTWFVLGAFLSTLGFSILSINLNTIGGMWSRDYHTKTKIAGFREALGLIGLVLAAALPSILKASFDVEQAFQNYALILLLILFVSAFIFLKWYSKFEEQKQNKSLNFSEILSKIKIKRQFFTVYFVSILASSIPAALIIFFVRDRLQLEESTGVFLLAYFLSGAASMVLWQKISRRSDKITAWGFSMLVAVITFIWAFFIREGDFTAYLIICITSGIAFGAELVMPPSILADLIDQDESGNGAATSNYSAMGFLMKSGLAIATGTILPLLGSSGFEPGQENSETALFYLSFYYALVPCIIKLCAAFLLYKWSRNKGVQNVKKNFNYRSDYVS